MPFTGAAAVLANVTGTEPAGPGYITISPRGIARPNVSNVNLVAAGLTRPNAVLVPLGNGDVTAYGLSGVHMIVDVFGYFTG